MDEDLLARAHQGDQQAFALLIEHYTPLVWRIAWVLLRERAGAEDALQDAWLDVWHALPRFQLGRPFRPWLVQVVANRCRTALRKRHSLVSLDTAAAAGVPAAWEGDAATLSLRHETDHELHAALRTLPTDQRTVIELRFFAELEHTEIAAALHVPVSTVKSRIRRALASLRLRLSERALEFRS